MASSSSARRGVSLMLSSSSAFRTAPIAHRIPHYRSRNFSSSPVPFAFTTAPRAAASTTTTSAAKPAASTTAAKSITSTTTTSSAAKPAAAAAPKRTTTSTSTPLRTVTPSIPAKEPPVPTNRSTTVDTAAEKARSQRSLTDGLEDAPPELDGVPAIDWTRSYHGLGSVSFTPEQTEILLAKISQDDVEVKPDGIIYLPEIKYRRILNKAFGPGGWGLAPRGETIVSSKIVTREYGLIVQGRLVSLARGEQQYFDADGIPTATEGCKSNALMRCCKDLGIASELWDPRFIREFTRFTTKEVWVEHVATKKKRKIVIRRDDTVRYPYRESTS